jgi:hypothetical protein
MKFRRIEIEDTHDQCPYLLISYPTWSRETVKTYYAIRNVNRKKNGFCKFQKYVDGSFLHERLLWRNNFNIYTIIPFYESRLLNQLLRQVTCDPSFYCDLLDHKDFIVRF